MQFEEVYGGWPSKRLNQEEATFLLGICSRTFRRYINRYTKKFPFNAKKECRFFSIVQNIFLMIRAEKLQSGTIT